MANAPGSFTGNSRLRAMAKSDQARLDDRTRGTAQERGYTYRWAQYARQYRKDHPLCEYCLRIGAYTPTTCVDHKLSAKRYPHLFWDPSNHAPSCDWHNTVWKVPLERADVHPDDVTPDLPPGVAVMFKPDKPEG